MHPARSGAASHEKHRFAHPVRTITALDISPGMKTADFGAGSGAYVLAIAEILQGNGVVYAVDIQKDLLRRIKNDAHARGLASVEVVWGDVEAEEGSKIAGGELEFVLVSNLLFQLDDPYAAIQEAFRVLRSGGRLAIIDWSESLPAGRQALGRLGPQKEDVVPQEDAYDLARAAGFTFMREFKPGAHHYGLLFRKTADATPAR
jgi:ubiquinone/menaquinone biosynthesis C-methylase UbiE